MLNGFLLKTQLVLSLSIWFFVYFTLKCILFRSCQPQISLSHYAHQLDNIFLFLPNFIQFAKWYTTRYEENWVQSSWKWEDQNNLGWSDQILRLVKLDNDDRTLRSIEVPIWEEGRRQQSPWVDSHTEPRRYHTNPQRCHILVKVAEVVGWTEKNLELWCLG